MRHFLCDAFFKERRKLTAEWKSAWQNGLGLNQRNAGVKVLCLTTWLPFYIQGYEFRNPIAISVGSATSIYLSKALGNILIIVYAFSAKDHGKDDISVISLTLCCKLYLWQPS